MSEEACGWCEIWEKSDKAKEQEIAALQKINANNLGKYITELEGLKSQVRERKKEIAELKEQRDHALDGQRIHAAIKMYDEQIISELKSQLTAAREALEKYGRHINDGLPFAVAGHTDGACPAWIEQECVCGFKEALAAIDELKGKEPIVGYCKEPDCDGH